MSTGPFPSVLFLLVLLPSPPGLAVRRLPPECLERAPALPVGEALERGFALVHNLNGKSKERNGGEGKKAVFVDIVVVVVVVLLATVVVAAAASTTTIAAGGRRGDCCCCCCCCCC